MLTLSTILLGFIKENLLKSEKGASKVETLAWLLFLVCGIIYLVASIRDRDLLMVAGSACFVVAVFIFLIPSRD